MWVAKFAFDASKALIGGLAVKHKVILNLYPFYIQERNGDVKISFFIMFRHDHARNFVRDLRKQERIMFCNHKDRFLIGQALEPLKYSVLYNPEIIHLEPWLVDGEKSVETFVVGSRKRKCLSQIAQVIKEKHLGRLEYIKWRDITQFFIVNVVPTLTQKQRKAIDLAIRHGYYEYPRKTTLKFLARIMKVSYATYQAHLRKAEHKLLPSLAGNKP
jgi:predicted DNA binding protein